MQSGDRPGGRFFEDLSRLAGGALGAAGGVKADLEAMMRAQASKLIDELELVRREEFEAVREMAQKARAEQETLAERVAALEARLAALEVERNNVNESG
jgi:hypothetical protein